METQHKQIGLNLTLNHLHTLIRKLGFILATPGIPATITAHARQIADLITEALVDTPVPAMVHRQTTAFKRACLDSRDWGCGHRAREQSTHVLIVDGDIDCPGGFAS